MDRSTRNLLGIALGLAALAAATFVFRDPLGEGVRAVLEWAAGLGPWGGLVLAAIWIPAAVLFVPGSILTLGTGFLLGVVWGTVVVSIGSTLGAIAAFLVARWIVRDRIRARYEGRPKFEAVDEAAAEEGFTIILLLRLSPIFPYNVQNYLYGATAVPLGDYALASWIGMLPGTLLYVWLGASARTLAAAATGATAGRSTLEYALFAAGLLATGAAVWLATRRARRALARRREFADVVEDEADG
ncbi:MAG: TVP38/TMEM64 family protein [Gemmatimonadota bacterium]|nr:TVP38/TMEM64 family protein [Gemmatimonadota bacterium]